MAKAAAPAPGEATNRFSFTKDSLDRAGDVLSNPAPTNEERPGTHTNFGNCFVIKMPLKT